MRAFLRELHCSARNDCVKYAHAGVSKRRHEAAVTIYCRRGSHAVTSSAMNVTRLVTELVFRCGHCELLKMIALSLFSGRNGQKRDSRAHCLKDDPEYCTEQ